MRLLALDDHVDVGPRDPGVGLPRHVEAPAGVPSVRSAPSSAPRSTPRSSAAATNMSPAIPPMGSSARRAAIPGSYSRATRPATKAAPKPLSTFTTVTFGAQELSMVKRGASPPSEAP